MPVDKSKWSDSSKRSFAFEIPKEYYEDINYECRRCEKRTVYMAAEQKIAFEEKKAYVWQRRVLCPKCWEEKRNIELELRNSRLMWKENKSVLQEDRAFLQRWRALLIDHNMYGAKFNTAISRMLNRLLELSDNDPTRT